MALLPVSLLLAAILSGGAIQVQVPDSAREAALAARLFASDEPLVFTVEAPLTTAFRERTQAAQEVQGKLILAPGPGDGRLDVGVRTRGHVRLQRDVCAFPPLRLDLDREEARSTVFRDQNRLKLVTHCQSGRDQFQQYVLQEYLVYRVFQTLTERSFRTRLATVTYIDTDNLRDTVTSRAFLIEDAEMLAARVGVRTVDVSTVPPDAVDPDYLALVSVFEYLVGNPDWSAFAKGPEEEECCHNTRPIGDVIRGPVYTVPYDFDVSGIVNPRYGDRVFGPAERGLGITRIRQRVYRGLCLSQPLLPAAFALFNQRREAIYAVYRNQADLDPGVRDDTLEYLDAFYETINDPRRVASEINRRCRS